MSDYSLPFQEPVFHDEHAARQALENLRWPDGPYCPHCGNSNQDLIAKVEGKKQTHRPGLYYCNECKGQFTVTVGTVFERSKVPLTKWWAAAHMMNSSKNGVSAHEIHRNLGVTYRTAWFMMHRLREAMIDPMPSPMGSNGGAVQSDETYHLNTSKRAKGFKHGFKAKAQIVALIDEETKTARTFHVEKGVNVAKIQDILFQNVKRGATLVTDEAGVYIEIGKEYASHQTMKHTAGEYVNAKGYTTNNVENFFGIFKRGMRGTYTFCGEQHLKRYLVEFEFRYNNRAALGINDGERTMRTLKGIEGKRLTYRSAH
jgi:transposase-like protein